LFKLRFWRSFLVELLFCCFVFFFTFFVLLFFLFFGIIVLFAVVAAFLAVDRRVLDWFLGWFLVRLFGLYFRLVSGWGFLLCC